MNKIGNHIRDNTFAKPCLKHHDYSLIDVSEQGDKCSKINMSFFWHFLYNYPFSEMNIPRIFFSVKIGSLFKISESELGFSRNKKLRRRRK